MRLELINSINSYIDVALIIYITSHCRTLTIDTVKGSIKNPKSYLLQTQ